MKFIDDAMTIILFAAITGWICVGLIIFTN